jgi:hypothetical protein
MKETVGTRGLILNEPFLWERGGKGRTGLFAAPPGCGGRGPAGKPGR